MPLPVDWKTDVAKVPIENCGGRRRFQCPKKWDHLEESGYPEVRFCTACQQFVYYCESVEQAWQMAEGLGRCVVINLGVRREVGDMDPVPPAPVLDMGEVIAAGPFDVVEERYGCHVERPGFFRRMWRRLTGR